MSLYFVRHGESVANVNGTAAGAEDDCALTEKGLQDAQLVAENVKQCIAEGLTIDRLVSSPLQRALITAQIIADVALDGMVVQTDDRLRERGIGAAVGWKDGAWYHLEDDPAAGVESRSEFSARVAAVYNELTSLPDNTLVVSHNGVFKVLSAYVAGVPADKFVEMSGLDNGEIVKITKSGELNE